MGKYENKIRVAQIQSLVEEKKYKKAAALLGTMDVMQIHSRADLHTFAEIYMKTEQFAAAKATYLRLYKRNHTTRMLHRLIYLSIRTNELEDAETFYESYLTMSHNIRENLILRYRIDKAKGAPIGTLIDTLKQLKEEEYIEEWAYELAKLYQKAGRLKECEAECEDIKLWFGQGEIVERAILLLTYLHANGELPYYQDKDYTVQEPENPNPADTGSLPDLDPSILRREREAIRAKKLQEKEEREASKRKEREQTLSPEEVEFVDNDVEIIQGEADEGEMNLEPGELVNLAKQGFKKLTGLWRKDAFEEEDTEDAGDSSQVEYTQVYPQTADVQDAVDGEMLIYDDEDEYEDIVISEQMAEHSLDAAEEDWDSVPEVDNPIEAPEEDHPARSMIPTGVTQDLAKEIAAIFEMEHKNQLKEKGVEVIREVNGEIDASSETEFSEGADTKKDVEAVPEDVAAHMPVGMEEIVPSKEDDITMIDLDKIMPEPNMPEYKQVLPEDSSELEEQIILEDKDLPTTRALHRSFKDMLTLIAGELEPRHFVLLGDGDEHVLGISKQIVRVMHQKDFLSTTQIAKINATQLNQMDLLAVAEQLKGSCLLIDHAAQLIFPTITRIFALMDEFHGDFMVILADEGNTLDEMFKVAPALSRRFEYIIDISKYSEEDYQ